jgi:hypothetical protein
MRLKRTAGSGRAVNAPLLAVPAGFDPADVLPVCLHRRGDDARWFLHTIVTKTAHGEMDEWGYVRLDSRILRRVMSKRTQPAVVNALVDAGVIDPPAAYFAGVKAKGYRFTQKTLGERCKLVEAQDRQLIKRLQRERERLQQEEASRWLPIHNQLAESQRGLTILPAADTILEGLAPAAQLCQCVLVENIKRGVFKHTVSNTGRCFNALTGLKRDFRKTVRLAGEPVGGADIRCAQPTLLSALIRLGDLQNVPTYISTLLDSLILLPPPLRSLSGLPGLLSALSRARRSSPTLAADFSVFESAVLEGDLYCQLVANCKADGVELPDDPGEARDRVKVLLMRDVLAKNGHYPSPFEEVFQRAFPSIYRFAGWINRVDHAELIRTLQRLESWLVVENVAPHLIGRFPIVTLHDAIFARTEDLPAVVDAFGETFKALGIQLRVKAETLPVDTPLKEINHGFHRKTT